MADGLQCGDEMDKNKTVFCHSLCCSAMSEGFGYKVEELGKKGWCSNLADGRLNMWKLIQLLTNFASFILACLVCSIQNNNNNSNVFCFICPCLVWFSLVTLGLLAIIIIMLWNRKPVTISSKGSQWQFKELIVWQFWDV